MLRGGGSTAKYNTTNLIKHIQKHHAKEHAKFLQLNKPKEQETITAQQLTLAEALQRREKFLTESLKVLAITESFWINCFRCSTNVNCWRWGLRSPTGILRAKVLSSITQVFFRDRTARTVQKKCANISKEIKDLKAMSFTTDIWSSAVCPMSLLSLTVHWLDTSCTPHGAMLQAKNFHGSHTSDNKHKN